MKRPRSYDEDADSSNGSSKERSDRYHRRFYDRSIDDDRDSSRRPHRRRFDHSPGFDRYRDGSGGGGGGGERMHRSESFSTLRRDYPKGHRSERSVRDRSWQQLRNPRSSTEKEPAASVASDLGKKKPADLDTSCFRTDRLRYMESLSGEISKRIEKKEKVNRESCSGSEMEMEEGELQPEPEPEPKPVAEPEKCAERREFEKKVESNDGDREETEKKVDANDEDRDVIEKKLEASNGCINGGKEEDLARENGGVKEWRVEEIWQRVGEGNFVDGQEEIRKDKDKARIEAVQEEKQEEGYRAEEDVDVSGKKGGINADVESDTGVQKKEEEEEEGRGIDLEAEPESAIADGNYQWGGAPELAADKVQEIHKDKGKSIAMFSSNREDYSVEDGDAGEGPSSRRGFELLFPSDSIAHCGGITIGKHKGDHPKLETLDLSLSLPGVSLDQTSKQPDAKPSSPSRAMSLQSLPSSFRTNSDGFTNSISISGSQTFVHNPSCSLMQNSLDNFEQSVGSRPLFQGVDQVSNSTTVWQAQASNDPKPLFHRMVMNGNPPHNSIHVNGHLNRQSSIHRQLSPTQSHGSSDTRSERSKNKRLLTRERSSSSLLRSERKDGEQLVLNGGGCERIISKIVSEPLQVVCRIFQETIDHSIAYLKETIHEMLVKADKNGTLHLLQEILERRSDLTTETMLNCPRNLLEIFLALKTGLPDFLRRSTTNVPSSDLVEIFFNLKCRNLACRSMLPVDDCECKVCVQKSGFCSACMCLVCSKFDNASNTCGWVGCDVCLHWCHTDCGLRGSHIRNGQTSSGAQGITEMQFHCIGCDHPSEMFGFVKDVFKTCGKSWNAETLAKELNYVRRIFSTSNDVKGKRLSAVAELMLTKLADNVILSEAIDCIMGFFSDSEANTTSSPLFPPKEPSRNVAEGINVLAQPSKEAPWLPSSSYCLDKVEVPQIENTNVLFTRNLDLVGKLTRDTEIPMNPEKKPAVDELESIVRCKQAEAKMYQERADNARREAEGLKHIAAAKNEKIDEEYSTRIAKLRLLEAEEHRRRKLEELQVIERAYNEFFSMKMRMQSDISALLMKMEAMKRNINS